MTIKQFSIGLVSFIFSLISSTAFSQELPFTHYTKDNEVNPLPSADVRSIYQDRQGYLWIVIYSSGLVRYDGHRLNLYTVDDGLPDLTVRQVLEDQLGRLWVAGNAGLVVTQKPLGDYAPGNRIRFISKIGAAELAKGNIIQNRLGVDSRGVLWVGTREDGIIRYRFENVESVVAETIRTDVYGEGKNRDVRSIAVRRDGSVWVGIGGGDVLIFKGGSTKYDLLAGKDGLPRIDTDVLYESRSGEFFGGCRNGIVWRLVEGFGQRRVEVVSEDLKSNILCIVDAPEGVLWAASEGSGVMKMLQKEEKQPLSSATSRRVVYTRKNGLLSDNVNYIIQDKEGNIWFAQSGGVSKLRANHPAFLNLTATSHAGERPILPNPSINVVIPPTGTLQPLGTWIGTAGGGIAFMSQNGEVESIQADGGLRSNLVNCLALDQKGRVWIGTEIGMNCLSLDPKTPPPPSKAIQSVKVFDRKGVLAGYRNNTVISCKNLPLPDGITQGKMVESIWFASYRVLYCYAENEWFLLRAASGLPVTVFQSVEFDDEGRLWVGTRDRGLYRSRIPVTLAKLRELATQDIPHREEEGTGRFAREVVTPIFEPKWDKSNGAPSNQIETILWRDGALWVGTLEGLAILEGDPPKMTAHMTMSEGLKANNVTSMTFSPVTGSLWVGTNAGLAEIDPKTRKVVRTVTEDDGLVDNEVWFYGSVAVGTDGTVYFGTPKGLSLYWPNLDIRNQVSPVLKLEEARFTENSSGDNEIAFEYAALSFANERLVRYKTRLVGYDREWSPEKTDVRLRYTNLSAFLFPKAYTFEVLASNNAGLWAETPLAYSFSVSPPWWFRWWSAAAYLVALVGFVYTFSRYRVSQLEERKRELEQTVEERTQEIRTKAGQIRQQADEIDAKNQELIRTQEQLIMQEKLASLGSLTAAIAHEIKNPLNFVNNFADLTKELTQILKEDIGKQKDKLDGQAVTNIEDVLRDLEHNVAKISEHGKRADSIVRSMLLHTGGKAGERLPTDINILLDEYVHLAYHGLRAQDPDFNVKIETDFDQTIGEILTVPQDLGRVFLNIVNNACYAVNEKKKETKEPYSPTLTVRTKNLGEKVEVRIRDNGKGIPRQIVDRIFEPFFTTKPTGKGTGLGLSLSYDIIAKEHNGQLKVETEEGTFAEFIIFLPKRTRQAL